MGEEWSSRRRNVRMDRKYAERLAEMFPLDYAAYLCEELMKESPDSRWWLNYIFFVQRWRAIRRAEALKFSFVMHWRKVLLHVRSQAGGNVDLDYTILPDSEPLSRFDINASSWMRYVAKPLVGSLGMTELCATSIYLEFAREVRRVVDVEGELALTSSVKIEKSLSGDYRLV